MKKLFIIILLSIALIGCATFNNIKQIHETIYQVSNGEVIHEIKAVELTSTELTIVDHSINNLKIFIDKWNNSKNITNLDDFIDDYTIARSNYLAIHKVIFANYDKYPKELQDKFLEYQKHALKLDSTVQKMILGKDIYNATKTGVKLAMVVVGMLK